MSTTVSETVARPVRTVAQGGVGWLLTETIDVFFYDLDDRQYGVLVVLLGTLTSFVQTVLENKFGKAFMREVPFKDTPVVDDNPEGV